MNHLKPQRDYPPDKKLADEKANAIDVLSAGSSSTLELRVVLLLARGATARLLEQPGSPIPGDYPQPWHRSIHGATQPVGPQ